MAGQANLLDQVLDTIVQSARPAGEHRRAGRAAGGRHGLGGGSVPGRPGFAGHAVSDRPVEARATRPADQPRAGDRVVQPCHRARPVIRLCAREPWRSVAAVVPADAEHRALQTCRGALPAGAVARWTGRPGVADAREHPRGRAGRRRVAGLRQGARPAAPQPRGLSGPGGGLHPARARRRGRSPVPKAIDLARTRGRSTTTTARSCTGRTVTRMRKAPTGRRSRGCPTTRGCCRASAASPSCRAASRKRSPCSGNRSTSARTRRRPPISERCSTGVGITPGRPRRTSGPRPQRTRLPLLAAPGRRVSVGARAEASRPRGLSQGHGACRRGACDHPTTARHHRHRRLRGDARRQAEGARATAEASGWRRDQRSAYTAADIYERRDRASALRWLDVALRAGYQRTLLETSPSFANLRADPRYKRRSPHCRQSRRRAARRA